MRRSSLVSRNHENPRFSPLVAGRETCFEVRPVAIRNRDLEGPGYVDEARRQAPNLPRLAHLDCPGLTGLFRDGARSRRASSLPQDGGRSGPVPPQGLDPLSFFPVSSDSHRRRRH